MFSYLRKKIKRKMSPTKKADRSRKSFLSPRTSTSSNLEFQKGQKWLKYDKRNPKWVFEDRLSPPTLDDFELLRTLGKGSQGKVVEVKSKKTSKIYALKIISKKFMEKSKLVRQVLNSLEIMAEIEYENLVNFQGCFEDDLNIYIILEKAHEESLFNKLMKVKKFEEEEIRKMMFQVFKGVNYLHTQRPKIIHRDLKPENIIFLGDTPKINDFCLSAYLDKPRKTYCGTRDYLPPEMIDREEYGTKADIWNLGIMLFELVTGETPFKIEESMGMLKSTKEKKLKENILKKKVDYPGYLSDSLIDLLRKLLERDHTKRISAAQALNHDWFAQHGLIFSKEKEKFLDALKRQNKRNLRNKRNTRTNSQTDFQTLQKNRETFKQDNRGADKKELAIDLRKINNPSIVSENLNFVKTSKFEALKELRHSTSEKLISSPHPNRSTYCLGQSVNINEKEIASMTVRELSFHDPVRAFQELRSKYERLKDENAQFETLISVKNLSIRDLEKQLKLARDKIDRLENLSSEDMNDNKNRKILRLKEKLLKNDEVLEELKKANEELSQLTKNSVIEKTQLEEDAQRLTEIILTMRQERQNLGKKIADMLSKEKRLFLVKFEELSETNNKIRMKLEDILGKEEGSLEEFKDETMTVLEDMIAVGERLEEFKFQAVEDEGFG